MWTPRPDLAPRWYAFVAWLTMGAPYLEQTADDRGRPRVRFHDAEGGVWTVWDSTLASGSHQVPLGDPRANHRHFIAADGTRRVAELKPGSDRRLMAELLAAQLRAVG